MQDIIPLLNEYCESHSSITDPLLDDLERQTHLKTLAPRMLSGKLQGQLLTMISVLKRPRRILEIGTFTGYSALCLAKGLTEDGTLTTIDIDEETSELARSFFDQSVDRPKIKIKIGDAKLIIPQLQDKWDLVFIDADKTAYAAYLEIVIPRCNHGAIIIVDNVLWSGKILDDIKDKKTMAIDLFNKKVKNDPRIMNVILPIRDGLQIIQVL
jgi:caffeoyl-CoA O-methyltransferase